MNFNAIDTHTNMECEADGVRLIGYVVDDGERWWVWARDERDARLIAGLSAIGVPLHRTTHRTPNVWRLKCACGVAQVVRDDVLPREFKRAEGGV